MVDDDAGCADARFSTIQSAVDAAIPGDQVLVCAGTYREAVTVKTDRLKIISRTLHGAVIEQPVTGNFVFTGVFMSSRGYLLRGFTIRGVPGRGDCDFESDGVLVTGSGTVDYNRITDLECEGDRHPSGVRAAGGPGSVTVAHNEISQFEGFGVWEPGEGVDLSVHDNVIREGGGGVDLSGSFSGQVHAKVQSNTIEDNAGPGIRANGLEARSVNLVIAGNRVRRNRLGIQVTDVGAGVDVPISQLRVRVEGNGVFDNEGDGIRVNFSPGYIVRNRSLGNGGFDCFDDSGFAVWKDNIGVTDSPPTLCRAP